MDSDLSGWAVIEVRASREALRRAFYEGPEWTQGLEGQLMPLLDGYASVLVGAEHYLIRYPAGLQARRLPVRDHLRRPVRRHDG
jgi:hypothetical protein